MQTMVLLQSWTSIPRGWCTPAPKKGELRNHVRKNFAQQVVKPVVKRIYPVEKRIITAKSLVAERIERIEAEHLFI